MNDDILATLAPNVLFTDHQNDNLFQMVEDFLAIVTKTDRFDNNLLFVVVSLEHVLNVTRYGASGRKRGRGPLINFDCEWNFQFGLRPSGKVEACDSLTGLCCPSVYESLTQNAISFCQVGVRAAACVVMSFDGIRVGSKLSVCLCWQRCQPVSLLCQPHSPLPSYSPLRDPDIETPACLIQPWIRPELS